MKILITGAAGFIGFHVSRRLLEKGCIVIGIDNIDDYYSQSLKRDRLDILKSHDAFRFLEISLKQLEKTKLKDINFAINLAAQPGVRLPINLHYKYDVSNKEGYISFLNFCKTNSVSNIIYASSSSVYSCISVLPYSEQVTIKKTSSKYAESKLYNEKISDTCSKDHNLKFIGLRFFTVYGEFGRPDMAYYKFINQILKNEEIKLFNKGNTSRDMTNVDDIVDGIMSSIEYSYTNNFRHEIFNLGNDSPISTKKLVSYIENDFNKTASVKLDDKFLEISSTHADLTKSRKLLNYQPKIDTELGLRRFFSWYKSYYKL